MSEESIENIIPEFAGTHHRYFMEMAYNGTNYHGWQVQPNGVTIQEKVNGALSMLMREPIYCIGCGRTDAGVHAKQFFLHFDAANPIPLDLVFKLNRFLGHEFAIRRVMKMHENAHARFDATERTYEYHMHFKEDPFLTGLSCFLFPVPDVAKMNQAAQLLLAYKDFKPLHKTGGGSKTTICHIYNVGFHLNETEGRLVFTITANRFLRNMVRMTMGALIMIGKGRITENDFRQVMDNGTEFKYMMPVPACGLYLTSVKYPYL